MAQESKGSIIKLSAREPKRSYFSQLSPDFIQIFQISPGFIQIFHSYPYGLFKVPPDLPWKLRIDGLRESWDSARDNCAVRMHASCAIRTWVGTSDRLLRVSIWGYSEISTLVEACCLTFAGLQPDKHPTAWPREYKKVSGSNDNLRGEGSVTPRQAR
jgi:hypothetical protein